MSELLKFSGEGFTATKTKKGWLLEYKGLLTEQPYKAEDSECFRNELFQLYRGFGECKLRLKGTEFIEIRMVMSGMPLPRLFRLLAEGIHPLAALRGLAPNCTGDVDSVAFVRAIREKLDKEVEAQGDNDKVGSTPQLL